MEIHIKIPTRVSQCSLCEETFVHYSDLISNKCSKFDQNLNHKASHTDGKVYQYIYKRKIDIYTRSDLKVTKHSGVQTDTHIFLAAQTSLYRLIAAPFYLT